MLEHVKSTIQIVTFNIRTLNRIGQLPELTAPVIDPNIDIICVQEHRYLHSEVPRYWQWVDVYLGICIENSVNAAIGGVGMLIGLWALKSLNNFEKIQPRMMVAMFIGNPAQQSSLVTALPMLVTKQTSLPSITSYPPLFIASQKHNVLITDGDMNAQIGKNIDNSSNRNGGISNRFHL